MNTTDLEAFEYLQFMLVRKMKQSNPSLPDQISDWKGQNIADFQNQLLEEQKAQISEKWFYTHMKKQSDSLPRIDVLNFLTRFVGYKGWEDFLHIYSQQHEVTTTDTHDKSNIVFIWVPILTLILLVIVILVVIFAIL